MMRWITMLALLAFAAICTAFVAAASSGTTERVIVRDRAGDPEDGNYKRYPARRDLDLRRVVVERTGKNVRVTWETAAPATRSIIYTFNYYNGAGRSGAIVEIRLRANRSLSGYASKEQGGFVNTIPRYVIRLRGRQVSVAIPARFIAYMQRFRWDASAGTIGRTVQILDQVPNAGKSILNSPKAKFP
jgi:hypothetical protein